MGTPKPGSAAPLVEVTADDVGQRGFFCYMSKKRSEGYQRKLRWVRKRFAEGMRIRMLAPPERGFIEYLPGEYAWRAVHADGYLFIHCLWVVGKSKGNGLSGVLLDACLADAKCARLKGVAMVTSEQVWLAGRRVLERRGFQCVDSAPPAFSLMVRKFGKHPSPSFAGEWEQKARAFGPGLTILRSDQCPYVEDATTAALAAAEKTDCPSRVFDLSCRADVLAHAPTPYGVFGLVLDGALLSYHYLLEKDLTARLATRARR